MPILERREKPLFSLEIHAKQIIESLAQNIEKHPELQSLAYIKKYITAELQKRGF